MAANSFVQPLFVFVGAGFPLEVGSAWHAYEILTDWTGSRSPTHKMATEVCRAAIAGTGTAETARVAFQAFATKTGILAPDAIG